MLFLIKMISHLLIYAYLTLYVVEAQQNPSISYISPDKVVRIGDTVDMQCSVQYPANYPVIWTKINRDNSFENFLISRDSSLSIYDNRYSIRHDEASSTYTLQLSKIQETDEGIYQCQVLISSTSRVTANLHLTVHIPPSISDDNPNTIMTSPGATIKLECNATGNPKPKLSWRRENNELLPTGGEVYLGNILHIYNITKNDRGAYYCLANNGVGKEARRNYIVEVKFAPEVTVPKEKYSQAIANPVDLECHVKGYPHPTIFWSKNGVRVYDGSDYHITLTNYALDSMRTILRVKSITQWQFGKYTCTADNDLGSSEKVITVEPSATPICPPACDASSAQSFLIKRTLNAFTIILTIISFAFRNIC
ncbi:lachesin-like isoform X2 [Dinothrombium tinctorium]|uniref:Lachesin-like isoform X2 n=1 Tax=Dinothrombium tinctorium TaxID=1965070 RepID=A0A3S3NUR5_9ACAR|nr:lachesin-like isoform X2 [Dinothrombium tinctorium]RWS02014.1 lachesin-like isoform X2 [Dinothrombium tinctorium]RWS02267.1 lachesin-like isoform X2 [Dinothrombium tinctorium]RWS05977.1 lachesin-like isoform X2 [Dinothrombium tinctorium]